MPCPSQVQNQALAPNTPQKPRIKAKEKTASSRRTLPRLHEFHMGHWDLALVNIQKTARPSTFQPPPCQQPMAQLPASKLTRSPPNTQSKDANPEALQTTCPCVYTPQAQRQVRTSQRMQGAQEPPTQSKPQQCRDPPLQNLTLD